MLSYVYEYVRECTSAYTSVRVYPYVYMYVCVYMYICVYAYVYTIRDVSRNECLRMRRYI